MLIRLIARRKSPGLFLVIVLALWLALNSDNYEFSIAASYGYSLDSSVKVVTSSRVSGSVWAWGDNTYGELGDGTTIRMTQPAEAIDLNGVSAISTGDYHSLALKSDGTVWVWGANWYGELGDGTTTYRSTPVQLSSWSGVIAVAAGCYHSFAMKSDGTVWSWGRNDYGQLGDGTMTDRYTPVQLSGLSGVIALAPGGYHSLALKSDGTVWAWGDNTYGELGDGTTISRTTPVPVTGLNTVTAFAAGWNYSIALKSDGTVWSWGHNDHGQLGDGTVTDRYTPVQLSGLSGVTAVSAGDNFSLALKSDGTVWAWGSNVAGELGDITTGTSLSTPEQLIGLDSISAIAAGKYHSLVLKSDGTVWTWGNNWTGQLGDGATEYRSTPAQVNGLNSVIAIAAGGPFSLALQPSTANPIMHTLIGPSKDTVFRGTTFGPITSSITNNTTSSYSLYVYSASYTPTGSWVDSTLLPLTLSAGQTVSNTVMRYIAPLADTGTYYYCEYLFDTSLNQLDYKCVKFTVQ